MTDLHELLDRATDRIEAPHLAATAISNARRHRVRRRGTIAALAAAGVAAAAAGVAYGPDRDQTPTPIDQTVTPSPTQDAQPATAPAIAPSTIQAAWDPVASLSEIPRGDVGLPSRLVPGPSVDLTGAKIMALIPDADGVWLVDDSARWQHHDYPEPLLKYGNATLTIDGHYVCMAGESGLWFLDTADGEWRRSEYPSDFAKSKGGSLRQDPRPPVNDKPTIYLTNTGRNWWLDLATGEIVPKPASDLESAWAPDGELVQFGVTEDHGRTISQGGVTTRADALEYLQRPVPSGTLLAAQRTNSSYYEPREGADLDGLIVLYRSDLSTRAYLPVAAGGGPYREGGGLWPVGWLDAETLLFAADPHSYGGDLDSNRFLVTWQIDTGALHLVSEGPPVDLVGASFALHNLTAR